MNNPGLAQQKIKEYLQAVEQRLAHKPAPIRQDIIDGLREQIEAALQVDGRVADNPADVDRVLGEMDAPEDFDEAEAVPAARPSPRSHRGFLLALAFFVLNAYAVWRWSAPPPPPVAIETAAQVEPAPETAQPASLRLVALEQVDLAANRAVTLRLGFNHVPHRDLLTRYLTLSTAGQPEIPYTLQGPADTNSVWIQTRPVHANQLHIQLAAGLPATGSAPPTSEPYTATLTLVPELHLRHIHALSPSFSEPVIRSAFTAFPSAENVESFVEIAPPVRYNVTVHSQWSEAGIHLTGDFQPGHVYAITFKEGLRAANGAVLQEAITRHVQIPNRAPALTFDSGGRYLSPRGSLTVPLRLVNLHEWTATLAPVYPNNLVQMALRDGDWSRGYRFYGPLTQELIGPVTVRTNHTALTANTVTDVRLSLRDLDPAPHGVYWLTAGTSGRLIVITDLGIAARVQPGGAHVWVNSLQTAQPATGATVTAYARNNQPLATAVTDENGLARLSGWDSDTTPFIVVAQLGDDLSYIDVERARVTPGSGLDGAAYLDAGTLEAAVFTERGIYRPGETVFMQALLRDRDLSAPAPFPLLFRIRRPDGRVFNDLPVTPDAYGAATATVAMPVFLPTGRYTIELVMPGTFTVLGTTTIALEDFVPPQIRVRVQTAADRARAGSNIAFTVASAHLFGRPAAGLPVEGGVLVEAVPFQPPQWPGWRFGDETKPFEAHQEELGQRHLDDEGQTDFNTFITDSWRPAAALRILQWATVMESGGRSVSSFAYRPLDAYPFYIGLRPAWDGFIRVGETQRVSIVQVQPDGNPVAEGKPLLLRLSRINWNSVLREVQPNRYEWQSERQEIVIREDTLAASGEPADWSFALDNMGEYALHVRDPASGASTYLPIQVASHNQEWIAWSRTRPGHVELSWDRETYRPGDTARLLVKAPFAGTGLLTVEGDAVHAARVVTLTETTAELEIPVDADFAPNVYATFTLIRPAVAASVWNPHRASGSIPLPVQRPGHQLTVTTETPAVQTPQAPMTVRVTVRDEDDQPATGAVTLMAVDEGICTLTDFQTPDPHRFFTRQRALAVTGHDIYSELIPILDDELTSSRSVGGDQGLVLRRRLSPINARRFRPVALWQERVELDAEGRADIVMDIPEFTGELRVMAVAYNARQTGTTEQPVPVKRDLIVQPALPRFLAIGDTSDASIQLINEGATDLDAQIRVTCGGPVRTPVAQQSVALAAGAATAVPLTLVAGPGAGVALVRIEVEGGGHQYRETIELPVRPASAWRSETTVHLLAAGETLTLTPPARWLPETVTHTGAAAGRPALQLGPALAYLWDYPYGCLEQTVSGLFPLLHADAWLADALPHARAEGDINARVKQGIQRVFSMQQADGGFAWWPFNSDTANEPTLYAAHFLVEAQAAGYTLPPERMDAVFGWLRRTLDRALPLDAGSAAWADGMAERAYAAHILAIAGRPDHGWNARLAEQYERLYYDSRVHVAAALLRSGQPRRAVPILESMALPTRRERVSGILHNSDIHDAALLMSAWLEIDPTAPEIAQLADFLQSARHDGHLGNTYDNAQALLAWGKYERIMAAQERTFSATFTTTDGTETIPPETGWQWSEQTGPVTIANQGPGPLYVWSRFSGVDTEPETTTAAGITLQRDVFDARGERVDPSQRHQGELMIVRLTVDTADRMLDHLVIEDLLPAGWEIENPDLLTSRPFTWLAEGVESARHRDARDDRMLFFTGPVRGTNQFHYSVRAVTPGTYVWPAAAVSGMYEPHIRATHAGGEVRVTP
jgi:alpha-2-macroglobulin